MSVEASPRLSSSAAVLLAQSAAKLGTKDYGAISSLLMASPILPRADKDRFTPAFCEETYSKLIDLEGLDISATAEPLSRPARKLAWKLYNARLLELGQSVKATYARQAALTSEIDSLQSQMQSRPPSRPSQPSQPSQPAEEEIIHPTPTPEPPPRKEEVLIEPTPSPALPIPLPIAGSSTSGLVSEPDEMNVDTVPEEEEPKRPTSRKGRSPPPPGPILAPRKTRRTHEEEKPVPTPTPTAIDEMPEEDVEDENDLEEEDSKGKRKAAAPKSTRSSSRRKGSPSPAPDKSRKRVKTEDTLTDAEKDVRAFRRTLNQLMEQLQEVPNAHLFMGPVLRSIAPAYAEAVKRPMNIREVRRRIGDGTITTTVDVMRDVALICANAVQFNGIGHDISNNAKELWAAFDALMQVRMSTEYVNN